jgi:hypothetical protein
VEVAVFVQKCQNIELFTTLVTKVRGRRELNITVYNAPKKSTNGNKFCENISNKIY